MYYSVHHKIGIIRFFLAVYCCFGFAVSGKLQESFIYIYYYQSQRLPEWMSSNYKQDRKIRRDVIL